eukprot:719494_1
MLIVFEQKNKKKTKKKFPQILANVRKLKLNRNSQAIRNKNLKQNPFTYRNPPTASITEESAFDHEEASHSVTATSTRYGTWTADNTYGNGNTSTTGKKWRNRAALLPEPIRNLSTVAYTAPENLGHIDFASYEKLHNASPHKIFPKSDGGSAKKYYDKKKKKFTSKKPDGVLVTPQFERNRIGISMSLDIDNTEGGPDCELSIASEPIEMNDDGVAKDRTVTKDRMVYSMDINIDRSVTGGNNNMHMGMGDRNDRLISG